MFLKKNQTKQNKTKNKKPKNQDKTSPIGFLLSV